MNITDLPAEIIQIIVDDPLCDALDRTMLMRVNTTLNTAVKRSASKEKISSIGKICYFAAGSGHLEVLKYAHENGCRWDTRTCSQAAQNGHLGVLKYARENGCPWDAITCYDAALNGHLEVLVYAHENGCPWNNHAYTVAFYCKHTHIIEYLKANGCPRE